MRRQNRRRPCQTPWRFANSCGCSINLSSAPHPSTRPCYTSAPRSSSASWTARRFRRCCRPLRRSISKASWSSLVHGRSAWRGTMSGVSRASLSRSLRTCGWRLDASWSFPPTPRQRRWRSGGRISPGARGRWSATSPSRHGTAWVLIACHTASDIHSRNAIDETAKVAQLIRRTSGSPV